MAQSDKYDSLYLDILKIGMSCLGTGLSYELLRSELVKKGYDFSNDCIELAVKQWFIDCFHHYVEDEEEKSVVINSIDDLDEHLDCNFILKGNICLSYVEHRTSQNNLKLTYAAIGIAILSLICQVFPINNETETENKTEQTVTKSVEAEQKETTTSTQQFREKKIDTNPQNPVKNEHN
ncbi:MAG: hypothetical protein RL266_2642 [Bacteroidota bacterium]